MEDDEDIEDDQSKIEIRKPFAVKMIRQLNFYQTDVNRRNKRKQRKSQEKRSHNIMERLRIKDSKERDPHLSEVLKNGNRIIAAWRNNQIHGDAEIYYNNGAYFKGIYQNGIKTRGHFKFPSGVQYIGHCFGNHFQGEGVLIYPNGKIIEGIWNNSEIVGKGKIKYPKGEVYYGEIHHFKKNGQGYLYLNDGSKYQGQFKDGLITGKGSYFEKGQLIAKGNWMNGELQDEFPLDPQIIGMSAQSGTKQSNLSQITFVKKEEKLKITRKQEISSSRARRTRPGDQKEEKKVRFC